MTGSISPLQSILAKYKETLDKADSDRKLISNIIKETTSISISEKEIEINGNTISFKTHPAKRQIIMFNKIDILSKIQTDIPKLKISDIK